VARGHFLAVRELPGGGEGKGKQNTQRGKGGVILERNGKASFVLDKLSCGVKERENRKITRGKESKEHYTQMRSGWQKGEEKGPFDRSVLRSEK